MIFENEVVSRNDFLYKKNEVSVYIKREDLLHKQISGNKFRKLKYNILEAKKRKNETLLTFGGAYSNHISATAYVGKLFNFKTIGIIRGEELGINLKETIAQNVVLKFAEDCGMKFKFITRSSYRDKANPDFINKLKDEFGEFYLVPQGGTNNLAIKGCQEILSNEDGKFDYICVAVGTGGTMSGLVLSAKKHQKVIGFSALKGDFLINDVKQFVGNKNNWELMTNYHFGGYAKINEQLITFINKIKEKTNVALDPIYTGKMFFGINELITNNYFAKGSKVLAIHTGGLQGIETINKELEKKGLQKIR